MKLKNVRIVNHDSEIKNANLYIENGKITKIEKLEGVGTKTVIPGFVETHLHGFANKDCLDGKESIEFIAKELAKVGVTSFLPTLMTSEWSKLIDSVKQASVAKSEGAKIPGLHLEGPFFSHAKKGAQNPKYIIPATKENIKELWDASNHSILRMGFAPEVNNKDLVKYIVDLGMVVNIGHTDGAAQDVIDCADMGATSATHLWNGMSGVANRTPGIAQGVLLEDRIYAELICDFVHVDPLTIKLTVKTKGADKVIACSDSVKPAGMPDGEYESGALPVIKKGNLITLKEGNSIAGGASSIDLSFKNLLSLGYNLSDVVKMTSYNAAVCHNLTNIGEIKENKAADLVILDNNMEIINVYVDGRQIK